MVSLKVYHQMLFGGQSRSYHSLKHDQKILSFKKERHVSVDWFFLKPDW